MLVRSSFALIAATAAMLAGCSTDRSNDSTDKFRGDQRLVANTVEDLESAASKGDGDQTKICRELLARDLVTKLSQRGSCAATVDEALKDTDSTDLTVEAVRISGASAIARVRADRGDRDEIVTMTLVKQGAGWRISGLGT